MVLPTRREESLTQGVGLTIEHSTGYFANHSVYENVSIEPSSSQQRYRIFLFTRKSSLWNEMNDDDDDEANFGFESEKWKS